MSFKKSYIDRDFEALMSEWNTISEDLAGYVSFLTQRQLLLSQVFGENRSDQN